MIALDCSQVLQTDTDVAWFQNPYGALKSGENLRTNILAQVLLIPMMTNEA